MKILKYFFSKTIHHFWFAPLAHARQISLKYPHSPNFMKKIKNQTREKVVFQKKLYMIIFLKKFIPSNRSEQNILVISVVQLKKIEIALNSMNFLEIHCYDPMRPPVFGYFILQQKKLFFKNPVDTNDTNELPIFLSCKVMEWVKSEIMSPFEKKFFAPYKVENGAVVLNGVCEIHCKQCSYYLFAIYEKFTLIYLN